MKKIYVIASFALIGLSNANAQFCLTPADSFALGSYSWPLVISADFNNDGKPDLATANPNSNNVSVLLSTGTGSFSPVVNYTACNYPSSVASADFNMDGNKDLAVANYNNGTDSTISILFGDGTGNFSTATNYTVGKGPISVISADFNGDAIPDLAVVNDGHGGPASISILLGTGTGNFGTRTDFYLGNNTPRFICSADFNNDGFKDLAVANYGTHNILVLLGTGTGSFGTPTVITTSGSSDCHSLCSADFNGDAIADLATANNNSSNVSILLGTGTGSFGTATNFAVGSSPSSIISTDFNQDGKLDLAVTNTNANNIPVVSVLFGTGTGSFGDTINFTTVGNNPRSVISADFNGDNKPDLVTANNGTSISYVSLLLNCTPTPSCVASVVDSLYQDAISPLTWDIVPHYSPQVTSARWYWGDGTSTLGLYPIHTYSASGWYNICVTAYSSCGDSASACRGDTSYRMANSTNSSMLYVNILQHSNTTAIQTHNQTGINIYPNPSNSSFTIETNTTEEYTVQVYDVNGKMVLGQNISGKTDIDASILNEGIYNISICSNESVVNKRLVIVR